MAIIVDKMKVAYFPVPKVACTSIKLMFYMIENEREFIPSYRNGVLFHIHNYYHTLPFGNVSQNRVRDHFRICVVRDPIRRFLSCYSNRVVFHRELREDWLSREAIEAGAIPNPTLAEFVERLEIYRRHSASILHHTDPQTVFLGTDPSYYARIYQMSELENLRRDLSDRAMMSLSLPHEQSGGPKIAPDSLSSNAREKIRKFYSTDYEFYEFEQ